MESPTIQLMCFPHLETVFPWLLVGNELAVCEIHSRTLDIHYHPPASASCHWAAMCWTDIFSIQIQTIIDTRAPELRPRNQFQFQSSGTTTTLSLSFQSCLCVRTFLFYDSYSSLKDQFSYFPNPLDQEECLSLKIT